MQGVAFDAKGQLWTVEHGLRGGDELNLIEEGKDYGWPQERLGTLYNRLPISNTLSYGRHDRFEPPVYSDWMRAQETSWTAERLTAFLEAPEVAAPGTTMPDPGIHDPGEIGAVVAFLAAMSSPLNPAAE